MHLYRSHKLCYAVAVVLAEDEDCHNIVLSNLHNFLVNCLFVILQVIYNRGRMANTVRVSLYNLRFAEVSLCLHNLK